MIHYVKGNLLESNCGYICHQVNCQGVMGSGIARQIRERWPEVYAEYKVKCSDKIRLYRDYASHLLGRIQKVQVDPGQYIINIFSQANYGYNGDRYTSYDALAIALDRIRMEIPTDQSIGFPKNIGCGLGGGNWNIVLAMIEEYLGETHEVYIYEYDPKEG